jgi:hypothetical protein
MDGGKQCIYLAGSSAAGKRREVAWRARGKQPNEKPVCSTEESVKFEFKVFSLGVRKI